LPGSSNFQLNGATGGIAFQTSRRFEYASPFKANPSGPSNSFEIQNNFWPCAKHKVGIVSLIPFEVPLHSKQHAPAILHWPHPRTRPSPVRGGTNLAQAGKPGFERATTTQLRFAASGRASKPKIFPAAQNVLKQNAAESHLVCMSFFASAPFGPSSLSLAKYCPCIFIHLRTLASVNPLAAHVYQNTRDRGPKIPGRKGAGKASLRLSRWSKMSPGLATR
jgi:hypothetical protein